MTDCVGAAELPLPPPAYSKAAGSPCKGRVSPSAAPSHGDAATATFRIPLPHLSREDLVQLHATHGGARDPRTEAESDEPSSAAPAGLAGLSTGVVFPTAADGGRDRVMVSSPRLHDEAGLASALKGTLRAQATTFVRKLAPDGHPAVSVVPLVPAPPKGPAPADNAVVAPEAGWGALAARSPRFSKEKGPVLRGPYNVRYDYVSPRVRAAAIAPPPPPSDARPPTPVADIPVRVAEVEGDASPADAALFPSPSDTKPGPTRGGTWALQSQTPRYPPDPVQPPRDPLVVNDDCIQRRVPRLHLGRQLGRQELPNSARTVAPEMPRCGTATAPLTARGMLEFDKQTTRAARGRCGHRSTAPDTAALRPSTARVGDMTLTELAPQPDPVLSTRRREKCGVDFARQSPRRPAGATAAPHSLDRAAIPAVPARRHLASVKFQHGRPHTVDVRKPVCSAAAYDSEFTAVEPRVPAATLRPRASPRTGDGAATLSAEAEYGDVMRGLRATRPTTSRTVDFGVVPPRRHHGARMHDPVALEPDRVDTAAVKPRVTGDPHLGRALSRSDRARRWVPSAARPLTADETTALLGVTKASALARDRGHTRIGNIARDSKQIRITRRAANFTASPTRQNRTGARLEAECLGTSVVHNPESTRARP